MSNDKNRIKLKVLKKITFAFRTKHFTLVRYVSVDKKVAVQHSK